MFSHRNRHVARWNATLALASLSLCGAAVLSACGGGEQKVKFLPSRIIAFGDENSLIDDTPRTYPPAASSAASAVVVTVGNGLKYTVNAVTDDAANPGSVRPVCEQNPIWVQRMAAGFGHLFPACNPASVPTSSQMRAALNAKVADVEGQVNTFGMGNLRSGDLVSLQAGAHDILAAYAVYEANPATNQAALISTVQAAGTQLGNLVVRITTSTAAKYIITTVPNMGATPFGWSKTPAGRSLLGTLSTRFNESLLVALSKDPNGGGRSGVLLAVDDYVGVAVVEPSRYGLTNWISPACTTASAPACTTQTLAPNATATTWLWAEGIHLNAGPQTSLGAKAEERVRANPL